ncbi:MAG TPA: PsiF family protein [Hyphomicrobiaceae bacterium]|jgi:hypothetical protein|nr:PsiF family protein [Hyphomicrobiaceae bacterium]
MRTSLIGIVCAGLLAASNPALAQSKDRPARSAASLECSKQADAQGLHGKARKSFRSKCLRTMKRKSA